MKKLSFILGMYAAFFAQHLNAQVTPVGSSNYGRISYLTYDAHTQNRIYATTLDNHIVVSNDNGATWQTFFGMSVAETGGFKDLRLVDNGTKLSFISLRKNNASEKIIFLDIATKSVVKTITMPNESDSPWVNSYDIFEDDTDNIIVDTNWGDGAATEGKAFVTRNGGANWTEIYYTTDNDLVFLSKVVFNPSNANQIFLLRDVGVEELGGFWSSTDEGATWTKTLDDVQLNSIAINPDDSDEMYVGAGGWGNGNVQTTEALYHTTDGGQTWDTIPVNWSLMGGDYSIRAIDFNPYNTDHIVVLEEDEVLTSFDGGDTWHQEQYPSYNTDSYFWGIKTSFNPFDEDQIVVSGDYQALTSTDGGQTFDHTIQTPFFASTGSLTTYVESGNNKHLYYGVQYGFVHRDLTDPNNVTEEELNIVPLDGYGNDNAKYFIDKNVEGRVFAQARAAGGGGGVFSVKDDIGIGGGSGVELNVSDEHGLNPKSVLPLDFGEDILTVTTSPNPNTVWGSFTVGNDDGTSDNVIRKMDLTDIDNFNVVIDEITFPTTDFAVKFLFPDATNEDVVLVATDHDVYKTTNGGSTWTQVNTNSFSGQVFDLEQNPLNPTEYSVATSEGIFASTDNGVTWTQQSQERAKRIFFSTENDGDAIAVNYPDEVSQFEVYYTNNSGADWGKVDSENLDYVSASSADVAFDGNNATIYIGSSDLGLVTYTIDFDNLGIDDPIFEEENQLSIYPNPATDVININSDKNINVVAIYDSTGKLVKKVVATSQIQISDLNAGIYFIKASLSNNNVVSTKFIKR